MIDTLIQDFRHAVRALRQSPAFSAVVVLTLALGIGATTALFTIIDGVLLRPLPFADASHIYSVSEAMRGEDRSVAASSNIIEWTTSARSIAALAAYKGTSLTLTGTAEPVQLSGTRVTPGFFPLLGTGPVLGRLIRAGDEVAGAPDIVVLSHTLWQDRLGADPAIVGKSITLNGKSFTVVGVAGADDALPKSAAFWMPLRVDPPANGATLYYTVLVRPRAGATPSAVAAELSHLIKRGDAARPQPQRGASAVVMPLHDRMFGSVQRPLTMLFGAVVFLMLIACANVASLLLARGAARQRDMAVRAALGAGRGRLIRQVLIESGVLAFLGAALGMLIPVWAVGAFVRSGPDIIARNSQGIQVNTRVMLFAALAAVLTGLLFGAAPAWLSARGEIVDLVKDGGSRAGASRPQQRLRRVLVAAELAIALLLVTGAGLLARSFANVMAIDPGFEPEHLVAVSIDLPRARYTNDASADAFFDQVMGRVRAIPGVQSASLTDSPPPNGMMMSVPIRNLVARDDPAPVALATVGREYPRTVGLQLVSGRLFDNTDAAGAAPSVLLSATAARVLFPDGNALGNTINAIALTGAAGRATVVGVVKDLPAVGDDITPTPFAYFAREQVGGGQSVIVVRSTISPQTLHAMLRSIVASVDPLQPIASFEPVDQILARKVAPRRLGFMLVAVFAGLALLLAAIGLYGLTAYQVAQRTREMGIRIALGATGTSVASLIVRQGLAVIGIGVAAGVALSLAMSRLLAGMLYGVGVRDPLSFVGAPLLLGAIALVACYLPARRASRVEPVVALRNE